FPQANLGGKRCGLWDQSTALSRCRRGACGDPGSRLKAGPDLWRASSLPTSPLVSTAHILTPDRLEEANHRLSASRAPSPNADMMLQFLTTVTVPLSMTE